MGRVANVDLKAQAIGIAEIGAREKFWYRFNCKLAFEKKRIKKILHVGEPTRELPFPNSFGSRTSFSESLQDIFVVEMTKGKNFLYYLEVGSGPPTKKNNTFLLERDFGWNGLSLDLNEHFVTEFMNSRKNEVVCHDATNFDYLGELVKRNFPKDVGYLQIDIDPSFQSLIALFEIPFQEYKFATITFEHDLYRTNRNIAKIARLKLRNEGYKLVVKNVRTNNNKPFEDWWVHPELVDSATYAKFVSRNIQPSNLPYSQT